MKNLTDFCKTTNQSLLKSSADSQASINSSNVYQEIIKDLQKLFSSTDDVEIHEEIAKARLIIEEIESVVPINLRNKRQVAPSTCVSYQSQLKAIQAKINNTQLNITNLQTSLGSLNVRIAIYVVKVNETVDPAKSTNQYVLSVLSNLANVTISVTKELQAQLTVLRAQESDLSGKIVIYCTTSSTTTSTTLLATNPTAVSTSTTSNPTVASSPSVISTSTITTKPFEQCGKLLRFFLFNF